MDAIGSGGFPFRKLTVNRTDPDPVCCELFRDACDRFHRFMGRDSTVRFLVTSVDVIHNPTLTERFASFYRACVERTMAAETTSVEDSPASDPSPLSSSSQQTPAQSLNEFRAELRRLVTDMEPKTRGSSLLHERDRSCHFKSILASASLHSSAAFSTAVQQEEELLRLLSEYDNEWRNWVAQEFEKYPNRISGNEGVNLIMAFQGGTSLAGYLRKASSGNLSRSAGLIRFMMTPGAATATISSSPIAT